ncbi:MAG: PTS system mannose/fructose/sorbose family transporter subunit IID [Gemmatimonadaceae bacterium]|nr:PTS system mannose/fructose/sorbose family transporter subunit IID [Gemmatimonadaceae bacterium]
MSASPAVALPLGTRSAILLRMLAIQGAWNYETLVGNGIGFCVEPALRRLPGGMGGEPYRAALARQSQYFNAHPYLAAVAVGALARAELEGVDPGKIERFRTAMCGPLGSVGDRLVWASWLPLCALMALVAFAFGLGPVGTVLVFLVSYNIGHVALRVWGINVGWREGLRVAGALGHPVLRYGPLHLARAGALVAGVALPLVVHRLVGGGRLVQGEILAAVLVGGFVVTRFQGRVEAWKWSLGVLAIFALYSVLR